MRKVTRKSLDELAKVMPVISEENQKMYVGGTSGYTGSTGYTGTDGSTTGYVDMTGYNTGNYSGGDESYGYTNTGNMTGSTGVTGCQSYPDISGADSGARGSVNNPYTEREYEALLSSGTFPGGYVRFNAMNSPAYIGKSAGETEIIDKFPTSVPGEVNNIMYQAGFESGFERGLNDDSFGDRVLTGVYHTLGVVTPADLRGSDYDLQKSYWGVGFTKGYQQGLKERARRSK